MCALLGTAGGCYQYQPISVGEVQAPMPVRLRLAATAVDRIRRGPETQARLLDGFQVGGQVFRTAGDTIVLLVPKTSPEPNARERTTNFDLALVRADVQEASRRILDRRRTALVVAGGLIATGIAASVVFERGGQSTGSTPVPPGPVEVRLPLLFRFGGR